MDIPPEIAFPPGIHKTFDPDSHMQTQPPIPNKYPPLSPDERYTPSNSFSKGYAIVSGILGFELGELEKKIDALGPSLPLIGKYLSVPERTQLPPDEYLRDVCKEWGWILPHFVYGSQMLGQHNAMKKMEGKQVLHALNHQSLWDVIQVPYNYHLLGIGDVAIVTRENMLKFPLIGKVFERSPVIVVPFDKNAYMGGTIRKTLQALKSGKDLLWWGEGTRSRSGKVLPFTTNYTSLLLEHANKHGKEFIVSPETMIYNETIEGPFIKTADFFKEHYEETWGKMGYLATDMAAFAYRFIRNNTVLRDNGVVLHVFGEPFDIRECKNGDEVSKRIYDTISKTKDLYQDRLAHWDIRQVNIKDKTGYSS